MGILDSSNAAPHINGTVSFTPNAHDGFDYSFERDGFPGAEAYYHDGNGGVQVIFQDPAAFRNPYDLFAIEPDMPWQKSVNFSALNQLNNRPPRINIGGGVSPSNTYHQGGR